MLIDSVTKRLAITLINNEKHAFLFHCTHGYRNSNIAVNMSYNAIEILIEKCEGG